MIPPALNLRRVSGIYAIIHRASLMVYVGSSVDIWKRYGQHMNLSKGNKSSMLLHRALREFSHEAFDFELLEECPRALLLKREWFYIVLLNAASIDGFNTKSKPHARYYPETSEATRDRISFTLKSKGITPPSRKGTISPLEVREKQSASMRGRTFSDAHKAALTASAFKRTAAHNAKIAASKMGKPRSQKCIDKIKAKLSGRKLTEEQRAVRLLKFIATKMKKQSATEVTDCLISPSSNLK